MNILQKGLFALALIGGLIFAQPASAQSFSAGSATVSNIGNDVGGFYGPYDQLIFAGIAGAFLPGPTLIGNLDFVVGPNCSVCAPTNGVLSFLMTVGANAPQSVIVPYAWSSTGPEDAAAFTQPAALIFGGDTLLVTVPSILSSPNSPPIVSGSVYATLTRAQNAVEEVPEPASMALLGAGLGILGMVRRRRTSNAEPGASLAAC